MEHNNNHLHNIIKRIFIHFGIDNKSVTCHFFNELYSMKYNNRQVRFRLINQKCNFSYFLLFSWLICLYSWRSWPYSYLHMVCLFKHSVIQTQSYPGNCLWMYFTSPTGICMESSFLRNLKVIK